MKTNSLRLLVLFPLFAAACAAPSEESAPSENADTQASALSKDPVDVPDDTSGGTKPVHPKGGGPVVDDPVATTIDTTPVAVDPDAADPAAPNVAQTSAGDGWRVLHVNGSVPEATSGAATAVDDDIIVLDSREAIATAPLGPKTRAELLQKSTLRSKNAAPSFAPNLDESMFTVVHKKTMDEVENPPANVTYFSICDDYDGQFSRSVSVDKSYSFHKGDETGAFTGSFDVAANLKGSASATVKYRAKTSVFAACKAVWVDFKKAQITGNADVTSNGSIDATFQKAWHYQKTIATPKLFDQWFTIGVVPVHLRIFAPIEAGLDANAKATLKASTSVTAKGSFDVTCGSSSCSGTKSASVTFGENAPSTFEAQVKLNVTPWAQGSLKAVLFDETIGGWGQVGVRASLPTDLWAYAGNTCGDANNDGQNELVSAATLDMSAKVDVVAKAGAFGASWGPWTWNVVDKHLLFKSFGDGSALDPIFYSEASGVTNKARMHGRMRPCVPFTDAVTYRITWSDGAVTTFTGAPTALFTQEHQFASQGLKVVKLEALSDAKGRALGGDTTRKLFFRRLPDGIDLTDVNLVETKLD